ncbi:MAG: nucleoside hydrolase, partial [Pediococcus parvulus]
MTTRIIMDCDPGIDDAAAISVALNNPEFDVRLITTVAGNVTVDKTTRNALKLVHFFDKKVPVASGAEQPLIKPFEDAARIHGESGMPGYDFDEFVGETVKHSAMEA